MHSPNEYDLHFRLLTRVISTASRTCQINFWLWNGLVGTLRYI